MDEPGGPYFPFPVVLARHRRCPRDSWFCLSIRLHNSTFPTPCTPPPASCGTSPIHHPVADNAAQYSTTCQSAGSPGHYLGVGRERARCSFGKRANPGAYYPRARRRGGEGIREGADRQHGLERRRVRLGHLDGKPFGERHESCNKESGRDGGGARERPFVQRCRCVHRYVRVSFWRKEACPS